MTGDNRIIYIKVEGVFIPVGCLTENSFSESSDVLDTTTRDNIGWKTSRPTMQSYTIPFAGLVVFDSAVLSYGRLREMKRNRNLLDWKIQDPTNVYPIIDYGKAYINTISEASPAGDLISFSSELTGFGIPLWIDNSNAVLSPDAIEQMITDGLNNVIQV